MNRTSHRVWIVLLVMMALLIAACMPVTPTDQASPLDEPTGESASAGTPTPRSGATDVPTAEATEEATEEATAEPIEEATPEPAAESAGEDIDIGALVRQILAQQLQVDLDQIEI